MADSEALCALCARPIPAAYEGVARIGAALVHGGCFVSAREKTEPAAPPKPHGRMRRLVDWIRRRPR